ncbi:MAG: hypothetical protein ACO1QS_14825 [Verrucomicrobiota bacterium]
MSAPTHTSRSTAPRPNRPTKLLAGLLVICFLLWCGLSLPRLLEPKYQGKTADQWFAEVTTGSSGSEHLTKDPAVIGLRHLGTNAVWFLWNERTRKASPLLTSWQKRLNRLTGKQNNQPPGPGRAQTAWLILFQFGPETEVLIPEALELLKNGTPSEAAHAARLLGFTQRRPELVVPAILQSLALTNRSYDERVSHFVALWKLGPSAKAAVPYLRTQLNQPAMASGYGGDWLAKAILTINGPGPEVDYFTRNLVPGNFRLSYPNLAPLEHLGTNARPAAIALHKFRLTLTNAEDSARVLEIIRKIDPEGISQKP